MTNKIDKIEPIIKYLVGNCKSEIDDIIGGTAYHSKNYDETEKELRKYFYKKYFGEDYDN